MVFGMIACWGKIVMSVKTKKKKTYLYSVFNSLISYINWMNPFSQMGVEASA